MENQDVNSIDDMSTEENTLPDDLYENPNVLEENQQTPPPAQIVDSSPENTSIEEADKKEEGVPEIVKEVVPHKEDPKQFEYWQGEADRRAKELEDFKTQYIQDKQTWEKKQGEIAEQLAPKPEPLVVPVKPSTQFVDDVETWANYYEQKDAYRDKLVEQNTQGLDSIREETANEKQMRLQANEAAANKAYTLGEFQKRGMDLEKANRALNYYGKQRENPDAYYDDLSAFFDWKENQAPDNRANQIQQRVDRQGEVLPLGVQTSETETKKTPEEEAFFEELKFNQGHGNY